MFGCFEKEDQMPIVCEVDATYPWYKYVMITQQNKKCGVKTLFFVGQNLVISCDSAFILYLWYRTPL